MNHWFTWLVLLGCLWIAAPASALAAPLQEPTDKVIQFSEQEQQKILEAERKRLKEENDLGPPGLIQNDAVIFGILMLMLGFIFYTSNSKHPWLKGFYSIVPMLLLCYFLPSLLTFFGIVNHQRSELYFVASRFLLPACLVLLTLSIDLREILRLGPKALIMFLTGTVGVVLGGPWRSCWSLGFHRKPWVARALKPYGAGWRLSPEAGLVAARIRLRCTTSSC